MSFQEEGRICEVIGGRDPGRKRGSTWLSEGGDQEEEEGGRGLWVESSEEGMVYCILS